jgi:hypothetical protein
MAVFNFTRDPIMGGMFSKTPNVGPDGSILADTATGKRMLAALAMDRIKGSNEAANRMGEINAKSKHDMEVEALREGGASTRQGKAIDADLLRQATQNTFSSGESATNRGFTKEENNTRRGFEDEQARLAHIRALATADHTSNNQFKNAERFMGLKGETPESNAAENALRLRKLSQELDMGNILTLPNHGSGFNVKTGDIYSAGGIDEVPGQPTTIGKNTFMGETTRRLVEPSIKSKLNMNKYGAPGSGFHLPPPAVGTNMPAPAVVNPASVDNKLSMETIRRALGYQ